MKNIKITIIILLVIILALAGYLYLNRHELFNKSIDRVLTDLLPPYIEIDGLSLDFEKKTIKIENLKILNPKDFSHPYLVQAPLISCSYKQGGDADSLKSISIEDIEITDLKLYIDRNSGGEINIERMKDVFKGASTIKKMSLKTKVLGIFSYLLSPVKNIDQLLDTDPVFNVSSGVLVLTDDYLSDGDYVTTVEDIDAVVILDLRKKFKGIDHVAFKGKGIVNGKPRQRLEWDTKYDPTTEKLTMANQFIIRDIDFARFSPYYDRFSPFIFKKARASGELMFNFDNGDIGSMNEIRFSDTEIEPKKDYVFNKFWPTGTEDLYRYFSDSSGEIVFDFKIKGTIDKPEFHLGSKTKQALSRMAIYKIADVLLSSDKDTSQQSPDAPAEDKSDIEKIIDILKSL